MRACALELSGFCGGFGDDELACVPELSGFCGGFGDDGLACENGGNKGGGSDDELPLELDEDGTFGSDGGGLDGAFDAGLGGAGGLVELDTADNEGGGTDDTFARTFCDAGGGIDETEGAVTMGKGGGATEGGTALTEPGERS